jgi:hypothetical protein
MSGRIASQHCEEVEWVLLLGLGTGYADNNVGLGELAFYYFCGCCGIGGKGGGTKLDRSCGMYGGN